MGFIITMKREAGGREVFYRNPASFVWGRDRATVFDKRSTAESIATAWVNCHPRHAGLLEIREDDEVPA